MSSEISNVFTSGPVASPGFFGSMEVRRAEREALTQAGIAVAGHHVRTLKKTIENEEAKTAIRHTGERIREATVTLDECIDLAIELSAGNEYKAHHYNRLLERGTDDIRGLI